MSGVIPAVNGLRDRRCKREANRLGIGDRRIGHGILLQSNL
jgi:hypothetical protein